MLNRLTGPGLFRLLLALLVFADHASNLNLGTAAVFIFFTLSGYWICTMWTARYSKMRGPYLTYIVSRLWRLLPTFMLCSIIAWTLLFWDNRLPNQLNWAHEALSNFLIFGYNSLLFRPIGPAWSLDIEVQFYLIAPLLIVLTRMTSFWILIGCALVSLGGFLLNETITVIPYLVFFAIGVASASFQWRPVPAVAWSALSVTLALIVVCVSGPFRNILLGGAHPTALYHALNGTAEVILAFLMAPWAIYTTGQKDTPLDGMLGDLSYIVYLLHWPVLEIMHTSNGSYVYRALMIVATLAIVLLGSALIWKVFDRPINRLRSKWVASRACATNPSR